MVGRPRSRVRERVFWRARLEGLEHEAACALVGVSQHRGWRWVREVGGMVPDLREPKGRYLSLAEQEEISRGLAADLSYAEIGGLSSCLCKLIYGSVS